MAVTKKSIAALADKKTIAQLIVDKNLTNNSAAIADMVKGKKLKVISSANGHMYGKIGTMFTASSSLAANYVNAQLGSHLMPNMGSIYWTCLCFAGTDTIGEIDQEIAEYSAQAESISSKIEELLDKKRFMVANDLTEFDEMDYKVYQLLSTMNKDASDVQKAKIISKLLKQGV